MSRSYKKPSAHYCGGSDKPARRKARKAIRAYHKNILRAAVDGERDIEDVVFDGEFAIKANDPFSWPSDGGTYLLSKEDVSYMGYKAYTK